MIPTTLGLVAYGRSWTQMGPWNLGGTVYRMLAVLSIFGCGLILLVGVQPPNDQNLWTVLSALALTAAGLVRLRAVALSRSAARRARSLARAGTTERRKRPADAS